MALSKVFTQSDRTRFARLALIIVEELTPILRDVLEKEISPSVVFNRVKANTPLFKNIRKDQLLIIQNAHIDGYRDFDITLLYTLIRNLCSNIPSPTQGWGISNMPSVGETTLGDDIERIRLIKDKLYSHVSSACVSDTEFYEYWTVMYGLCQRTGNHLHKIYIQSLQFAHYRPINEELEREWMEKIKKSYESEKEMLDVIRELTPSMRLEKGFFSTSPKVNARAKDPTKKEQADILLKTTIDLLNHMVDCINEVTTEEELKEIFDTVENLLKEGSNEIIRDSIKPFFDKLSSKIKTYANQHVRKISILAKFTKFVIFLRTKYGADMKSYQSSLLPHLTFLSKEGYKLYERDLERGEIGKEILDLLLYPVYLACFDLKSHDLIISLNNQTIYDDVGERKYQGLQLPESVGRKFPPTDWKGRYRLQHGVSNFFILDTSETMDEEGFKQMKETFVSMIESYALHPNLNERVAVIHFGKENKYLHYLSNNYESLKRVLDDASCSGPSEMIEGFLLAIPGLEDLQCMTTVGLFTVRARVILISDGRTTTSSFSYSNRFNHQIEEDHTMHLLEQVKQIGNKHPIFCVPVGKDPNISLLGTIAHGSLGGKLVYPEEARKFTQYTFGMMIATEIIGEMPTTMCSIDDVINIMFSSRHESYVTEHDLL
ncbi:uncharacterized protein LOC134235113, partial [Saccostrea cucullata]|uniref:uncharacterized protein LOC134235113 n=1 Tax=Saccostrea cuccullata TaxID=36930 RepID=UPI002ED124EB